MSKIEDRVAKQLLLRAKIGEKKYGTTMDREDLTLMDWLQHLQEELLDAAVYVEKLKQEVNYQEDISPDDTMNMYPGDLEINIDNYTDEDEERMDLIGRNGNDGLHYDNDTYWKSNNS